ncbi:MAG: LysR family transcriptional regulator, glycine cleavage system transcriptional activator [Rhodospirillaceae bacterium]|nr:LysR family transcriptional regulator, glycine cleavage system transcriptional activator [Rhodospirillaceae bacterium]
MTRQLPGLGALKTFEAAARLLSFTKAAEELGVTPAAVSYQMRALEDQLGIRLFNRSSRVVQLTQAGGVLQLGVSEALDGIGRTIARLRGMDARPRLTVSSSPSLAAKWLVPRLPRFLQLYPDTDVRVEVSNRLVDFAQEEVDLAIRFGRGEYPGLRVHRLFDETIFPVCSPKLLDGSPPLTQPRDLRHHMLIHVEWQALGATWPDWRMWMLAAGLGDLDATHGLHFSQTSLALQAAIDGQGVALVESTLAADDLASRRLVRPFELSLKGPAEFAYFALSPPATAERPLVKAFREWTIREAAETKIEGAHPAENARTA